ncbi:MAG TPA: efflux RND transporter periplasmic adaptor subunit, partial [Vicinamibacterales bacterium]|nr:efflux RND transporter periplasmic adaptor subunit [Vicinamibacterales bacterium]
MSKRLLTFIVLAVSLVAGGIYYYRLHQAADAPAPMTAAVTRGDVIAKVDATGTLAAVTTVQVGTQVSGTIKALHADYNSEVKKGQIVAELDSSLFQTQVDQARSTLIKVQADTDRVKVELDDATSKARRAQELYDQKLISRNDLETAVATASQAEAALKSAQAMVTQARAALNQNQVNLDHTIIRAPIDGIVISRSVDVGQTVAASMSAPTLFVIAQDLAHMQVSASIDESDIGRIAMGQPVTFRVDAYPAQPFRGTVSQVRLEPKTDQNVVSYTTMIDVPNEDLKLKPGMTANVTVQIAMNENVLRVPNAALRFRPADQGAGGSGQGAEGSQGSEFAGSQVRGTSGAGEGLRRADVSGPRSFGRVFVLRNGEFVPVRVRTGVSDGAMTAIVEGDLQEGDQVITAMSEPGATVQQQPNTSPLIPFGRR